jgi:hypothetical protein
MKHESVIYLNKVCKLIGVIFEIFSLFVGFLAQRRQSVSGG